MVQNEDAESGGVKEILNSILNRVTNALIVITGFTILLMSRCLYLRVFKEIHLYST